MAVSSGKKKKKAQFKLGTNHFLVPQSETAK